MPGPQPALQRQPPARPAAEAGAERAFQIGPAEPDAAAIEPQPATQQIELANSLLVALAGNAMEWLLDFAWSDQTLPGLHWFDLFDGGPSTIRTTEPAPQTPPEAVPAQTSAAESTAARPTAAESAAAAPATASPAAEPSEGAPASLDGQSPPALAGPTATEPAPPAEGPRVPAASPGRSAAAGPPLTADEIRARTSAAAAALPHPTGPRADQVQGPVEEAGLFVVRRNLSRAADMAAAPSRIVGSAPGHRAVPRPDLGPIPTQMEAVKKLIGRKLDPAALPPVTRSPRGTLPDVTRQVLDPAEIHAIKLGERGIVEFAAGTDPVSQDERKKLLDIYHNIGKRTATAPPVPLDLPLLPALEWPASAPVIDELVVKVGLPEGQRELLAAVVSELRIDPAAQTRQVLGLVRLHHSSYPGGALDQAFGQPFEGGLVPTVTGTLAAEVDALSAALALTPEELTAAMTDRRSELQRLKDAAAAAGTAALGCTQEMLVKSNARVQTTVQATAWAASQAVAADRAVQRHPDRTQARVERTLAELREPIAVELARLDEQLRQRERAIAAAVQVQVSAIRFAQVQDEIALTPQNPAEEHTQDRLWRADVMHWADAAVDSLTTGNNSVQGKLAANAQTQTASFKADLEAAATAALAALREWGAKHARTTETWWTDLDTKLQSWASDAQARATLWATQQGHATRIALLQDLDSLKHLYAVQSAQTKAEADAYAGRLDAEAQTFVRTFAGSAKAGAPDIAGAMAASMRQRVQAQHQADWEAALEKAVLALPDTEENFWALARLLSVVQPNWNPVEKAGQIHAAVKRWRGFDEEAIFETLADLTPLAAKFLPWQYLRTSDGQSLDDALHGYGHAGHLSPDELRTANDLLSGSRVEGAIGAMHSAISGPGAEMGAVNRIMRSLTPEERLQVIDRYPKRYKGDTLESDLNDQWSVSRSEVAETMLIAKSDLEGASATALKRSVRTVYAGAYGEYGMAGQVEPTAVIDRDAAAKVYSQIRQEVEVEAPRHGWLTPEVEAEITYRSQQLGLRFDQLAAKEWWAQRREPGVTPTEAAFALASPAGRDLLQGLATNDRVKIDVARIQLEDEGVYAEDAALNQIFREQETRSLQEAQRDYGSFLSAQTERALEAEGPFPSGEARINRQMELQRQQDAKLQRMANERTEDRMTRLDAAYQVRSGRSLEQMVEANMSFTSKEEGLARVRQKGVLTPYQKLRFSIEGVGTDMPMLRSTLSTMNKKEINEADTQWKDEHHGESLLDAIKGDTSGRDQDDLVDQFEHGAPQTAFQLYDAARRKYERDRSGETGLGLALTSSETAYARYEVEHMQKAYENLRRPSQTTQDQRRAGLEFDLSLDRANTAIELQRQALDSVTDALATITGIVVGILLIPFTGGASLVAVAAASAAATVATMLVKATVKGSAYGLGEAGTDLAVGVVDVIVSVLTAGLGRGLLGRTAATGAGRLAAAERSAISRVLASFGIAGRAAARGEAAGTGLLVRKLGSIGVLQALDTSKIWAVRQIGRSGAWLVEQAVHALPVSLAGALMDESIYRQPGGAKALFDNTIAAAVQNIGMAAAMHIGMKGLHGAAALREALRGMPAPALPGPVSGDILAHAGTPRERLAEFREWQKHSPEGTIRDFTTERSARLNEELRLAAAEHDRVRQARRELLAGLPASERGQYANLPIRSVSDAEFARLTGNQPAGAHLLVEGGRAIILVHEAAAPGTVASLLPAVREQVFPHAFGMTLEAALPEHLRDTPITIDPSLPREEIRVIATPETGRIEGVEVRLGPGTNPIDVALHGGEITRARRWIGRLGDARQALARFGERFGVKPVTPQDRTRFESAGEVRKLVPIIEERIRRALRAPDAATYRRLEAQILRLVAQHERAGKILSGELVAEARGYVAQEGEPAPKAAAKAAETGSAAKAPAGAEVPDAALELRRQRKAIAQLELRIPAAEGKTGAIEADVENARYNLKEALEEFGERAPRYAWLAELDLSNPADRERLHEQLEKWPQPDLIQKWRAVLQAEADVPLRQAAAAETLKVLRAEREAAELAVKHWSGMTKFQAGVPISSKLPEPRAGWGWEPKELARGTTANKQSHKNGYRTELNLANHIAESLGHFVLKYGAANFGEGRHGSDVISVDADGNVWLWDGKYLGSGAAHPGSATYVGKPLLNAIREAEDVVAASNLPTEVKDKAIANMKAKNFITFTVSSDDTVNFHSAVRKDFTGGTAQEPVSTALPWERAK